MESDFFRTKIRRQAVHLLPGIRGIYPYAPFRFLRQFGRRKTKPWEEYYDTYVYDIRDDRVDDASETLREWKGAKQMDIYTISSGRFNAFYDKNYKSWLKDNIKSISSLIRHSFCSIENKEAKVVIKLRVVKRGDQEMYVKFIENQDSLRRKLKKWKS